MVKRVGLVGVTGSVATPRIGRFGSTALFAVRLTQLAEPVPRPKPYQKLPSRVPTTATRRVGIEKRIAWITERLSLPTIRLFLVRSGLIAAQVSPRSRLR